MTTIRSLLFVIFFGLTVAIYGILIGVLGRLAPYRVLAQVGRHWARLNLSALRSICNLGYRVVGEENIPVRNCIVLAKHQSTWETMALKVLLPLEQTWVLKRELLGIPVFGWALARFQPISIDRKHEYRAMRTVISEGKRWLEKGRWVVIFPEGTRVAPGDRKNYGMGGALLASKTGYPVLPIAHNAGVFWRRRDFRKYAGTIDIVIGTPLEPSGMTALEINRHIEAWIESAVDKLPKQRTTTE